MNEEKFKNNAFKALINSKITPHTSIVINIDTHDVSPILEIHNTLAKKLTMNKHMKFSNDIKKISLLDI